ncbi:MAG: tetratricopeptide repeat protein [Deltaproteobacteria bacterium]|nr:tetratricopeptide repeat protein [Deltaproteobacteria bacterium]
MAREGILRGRREGPRAARAAVPLLLLIALLSSCADPARERFEGAEKALLEQRMEAALAGFRSIPKEFPQSRYAPAALLRQGDLYGSYYRNYPAAVEAYESLAFNYPGATEVPRANLRKGEILLLQFFNAPAAVETLERVRKQFPKYEKSDEVLLLLAKAYGQLPDMGREMAVLSELIEKYPASPKAAEARWMTAFALLVQGKFADADREFRRILYLSTDRADIVRARWGMGQALEGMGELEKALEQYEAIRSEFEDAGAIAGKIARLKKRIRERR